MKSPSNSGRRRWSILGAGAVVLVVAVFGVVALSAAAVSKSETVGVAKAQLSGPSGRRQEPIAVTSKGVAVYELAPETTKHPLCTMSSGCFSVWPPVKAGSAHLRKAAGVKGRLGTFRRDGFTQVTLNGHPLYTFVEDGGRKGVASGDGLHSFGGTWHVFAEGKVIKTTASTGNGSPAPTTSTGYTAPSAPSGY
jgi:predicted lipoprotein with Yx(FWY)xxD motif